MTAVWLLQGITSIYQLVFHIFAPFLLLRHVLVNNKQRGENEQQENSDRNVWWKKKKSQQDTRPNSFGSYFLPGTRRKRSWNKKKKMDVIVHHPRNIKVLLEEENRIRYPNRMHLALNLFPWNAVKHLLSTDTRTPVHKMTRCISQKILSILQFRSTIFFWPLREKWADRHTADQGVEGKSSAESTAEEE